jgi:DNA-binding transcriptional ArsR family regulator
MGVNMDETIKLQLLFQTLGDSNRLKIIKYIGEKECSVSEIVESTGLSQPLVSHHLKILRKNQILETKRKGPFIYYKLKDQRLLSALGIFLEIVSSLDDTQMDSSVFWCPPWWTSYWNKK